MEAIMESISARVPKAETEYIGEDGLFHCGSCHQNTQIIINFLGEKKKVRCICKCQEKEIEAQAQREKQEGFDRMRKVCFAESNMHNWNFQNDDRRNEKLSDAMKRYVDNFQEFRKNGKGLLLHGDVGTGKTYYAACIANALIDSGYNVLMTNFARLTNKINGMYDGKQEYIDSLNRYTLLIIDDLGAERKSEFMQEQVFNIIDTRYRSGLPLIITTNLTTDEIKKPQEIGYSRIYDRILERCHPIKVDGASRRRQSVIDTFHDMNEKLGL